MVMIRKPVQRSENIVDRRLEGAEHPRALALRNRRLAEQQRQAYEAMMKREAEAQLNRIRAARSRFR